MKDMKGDGAMQKIAVAMMAIPARKGGGPGRAADKGPPMIGGDEGEGEGPGDKQMVECPHCGEKFDASQNGC